MTLLLRPGEKSNVFYRLEINKSCWYRNHFSFFLMVNCVWPARSFSVFLGDETKLARPAAYDFEFRKIIFSYFFIVTAIQEEVLPPRPSLFSLFFSVLLTWSHTAFGSHLFPAYTPPLPSFFLKIHISLILPLLSHHPFSLSLLFCFGRPPFLSNLSNSIGWGGEVRVDPPTWVIIQCYFRNVVLSRGQNIHLQRGRKKKTKNKKLPIECKSVLRHRISINVLASQHKHH